jgi:NitT/TauT family transport system ATP-binding protein
MEFNWIDHQVEVPMTAAATLPNQEMEFSRMAQKIELVRDASKTYPGGIAPVFAALSLSIEEGTCLAVMGPNACGKSTLLSSLLGLISLDRGHMGLNLSSRDLLGVVVQDYRSQILPLATVRTNLLLPLGGGRQSLTNSDHILASATETFSLLGYEIDLNAPVRQLSGGGQQAVVLARALSFCPQFFIWDEPTSAIDLSRRRALYRMLEKRWHNTGVTVLFVTHDLDEALMLSDRIVVFDTGMRLLLDLNVERPFGEEGWDFLDSAKAQALRSRVRGAMDQGRARRLVVQR